MKNLSISHDPLKGRGVYAEEVIFKDQIIEVCELLLLNWIEIPPSLEGYIYLYTQKLGALALGHGSLYNHSNRANATFSFNHHSRQLIIKAKRKIKIGEEITINYGYSRSDKRRFRIA